MATVPPPTSAVNADRFWSRVERLADDACWPWLGDLTQDGYGSHRQGAGQKRRYHYWRSHRVAYELSVGPIPDGLVLDHLCRNRACCNPTHLEPVTVGENTRRGMTGEPQRRRVGVDGVPYCKNGHPVIGDNARTRRSFRRGGWYEWVDCMACHHRAGESARKRQ